MTITAPATIPLVGQNYGNGGDLLNTALALLRSEANTDIGTANTGIATKANVLESVTSATGTTYTLALVDAGTTVETSNAASVTVTVPANATVAFPVGSRVKIRQVGAGKVTVAAAGGVTLRAPGGARTTAQYAEVDLVKRATNEWVISGSTEVASGTATLTAGTVTVTDASATVNTQIQLWRVTAGGTAGALWAVPAAGSFNLDSSNAADTSVVGYRVLAY